MNRLLLVANLVLAVALCVAHGINIGATAHAESVGLGQIAAADLSLRLGRPDREAESDSGRRRLLLRFGTPMVAAAATGDQPRDLGLRLEPGQSVLCSWQDPFTLLLCTPRPLQLATEYSLHFGAELRALNGRVVPRGLVKTVSTPTIKLRSLMVDGDDPLVDSAFLLSFNMAADLASLREKLVVEHRGEAVPLTIDSLGPAEEHAYRVALVGGRIDRVEVHIRPGLKSQRGDLAMDGVFHDILVFDGALHFADARPGHGRVYLDFNRSIARPDRTLIEVKPAVAFSIHTSHRGLYLSGDFKAGQTLRVKLLAGFPGHGRWRLREDCQQSLLMPDASPMLAFAQTGHVFSSRACQEIMIGGVNVRRCGVSMRRLYDNNVVHHLHGDAEYDEVFGPAVQRDVKIAALRNAPFEQRVVLKGLLGPHSRGIYLVSVWDKDHQARAISRVLQITDLGVSLRVAPGAVAIQVVSLATGAPVFGAEVQVVTPTNQGLVSGRTDGRGVAVLKFARLGVDRRCLDQLPFMVRVRHGDEVAFLDLRSHAVELTDDSLSGRAYLVKGYEAFVQPSRGIIRPGETMQTTILVRDAVGVAPAGHKLEAVFHAPGGRIWARNRFSVDGSGCAHVDLQTPTVAPTGGWNLLIREVGSGSQDGPVLGRAAFAVQAFVPNRLEAELEVLDPMRIGKECRVRVRGRWLDGSPAANRPVILRVRLDRDDFAPDGFDEYSFARSEPATPPGALPVVRGQLDDQGIAVLRVSLPRSAHPQAMLARVAVEVMDPSGRGVHEILREKVLRSDFHLGIREGDAGVTVVALDASGKLLPVAAAGEVALEWRHYEWSYERVGRVWRYRTKVRSEQLAVKTLDLSEGRQTLVFGSRIDKRRRGWLVAVARCADRVCEQVRGTRPARPDRLRVSVGPTAVAPGSIVKVQVDSPVPGRGFVTLEGDGIHATLVVALQKGSNEIALPIPLGLKLPNVHAVVTLTRPVRGESPVEKALADAGKVALNKVGPTEEPGPVWLIGGASIALSHPERCTAVGLEGPAEVRPESAVAFAIHAPGAAVATVALVDEGVLSLTRHADPDPHAFFLARRQLDSRGADHGGFLMNKVRFRKGVQTGGDDSDFSSQFLEGSVNSRIRPVALFAGRVVLDGEGRGRFVFQLPAYEGRLRLMVIAAGPRVVGAASRPLLVKAPLSLQIATPRMLMPGDRTLLPITLKNHTGVAGVVRLSLSTTGGLNLAGAASREVGLPVAGVVTLDVEVIAGAEGMDQAGRQSLAVQATMGQHQRQVVGELMVRRPSVLAEDFVGLHLSGVQEVSIPGRWRRRGLAVELRIDKVPDLTLRGALESLLNYPHGCLEQTTSRCMGLLTCRSMLPKMMGEKAPNVLPMLQAGVDRIFAMQCNSGLFAWWPGGTSVYEYGSVHALDFLVEAKRIGVQVPERALAKALTRLSRLVRDADSISIRCHAIEVLSRAGRPIQPWLDFLASVAILEDDRARLAMALARTGLKQKAAGLLEQVEFVDVRLPPDLLRTASRSKAMQLRARLALGDFGARSLALVRALGRVMAHPARFTTQEKAHALRALAEYYRVLPSSQPGAVPVEIVVTQGDNRISLDPRKRTIDLSQLDPEQPIMIHTKGEAFGWLKVHGQRFGRDLGQPDLEQADSGLALHSVVTDLDSGAVVTEFQRGHVYRVAIELSAPCRIDNFLVTLLLPGGFEVESPNASHSQKHGMADVRVERRDDRVLFFVQGSMKGSRTLTTFVRAVFPGTFHTPALRVEAMYDLEMQAAAPASGPVSISEN